MYYYILDKSYIVDSSQLVGFDWLDVTDGAGNIPSFA